MKFLSNIVLKYQERMYNHDYGQNFAVIIMLIRLISIIAISNILENKHYISKTIRPRPLKINVINMLKQYLKKIVKSLIG